jgi:hypothetical protein
MKGNVLFHENKINGILRRNKKDMKVELMLNNI